MNKLVSSLNNSMAMWCGVPTPGEPKLIEPGLALAWAINSDTDLMPVLGCATSISVPQAAIDTGAKSLIGLKLAFLYNCEAINMVLAPISKVLPSGADLATASAPMLPLAPGWLTTTTG